MSTPLPNRSTSHLGTDAAWQPAHQQEIADKTDHKRLVRRRLTRTPADCRDAMVELLGRVGFATREQLARYLNVTVGNIRRPIETLKSQRLIKTCEEYRPFAYRLARKGLLLLNRGQTHRTTSPHVIHQHLLRNAIELTIKQKNPSACFFTRTQCLAKGLHPSTREHGVGYQQEGQPAQALVLIDDDGMSPALIRHALTRRHDPKRNITDRGDAFERWHQWVSLCLVYTTQEDQVERHKAYLRRYGHTIMIPTLIRLIPPVWVLRSC